MKDASHDGRIYAFTGGVTAAITRAVKRLSPHLEVKAVYGDGLKECNRLLKEYEEGNLDANFMEGMGCPHGCVGGPGTIIHSELAKKIVQKHAREALYAQAMDNTKAKSGKNSMEKPLIYIPESVFEVRLISQTLLYSQPYWLDFL